MDITFQVRPEINSYLMNDHLAIELICDDYEPFATLTVNLPGSLPEKDLAYVDTNNCPWAEEFLKETGLAQPTGETARSGYCEYPLCKFDVERIQDAGSC